MNKPHVFFLTGDSGVGKTTLIIDVMKQNQSKLTGFFVNRVVNEQGETEGFVLCEAQSIYQPSNERVGTWFIWKNNPSNSYDSKAFAKKGLELLDEALNIDESVILLDEIGGIELLENDFFIELLNVLERPQKIVGVFKSDKNYQRQQNGHVDDYQVGSQRQEILEKINQQGSLVELTFENKQQVTKQLKKFMST